jgi:hypothetical protein
MLNYRMSPAEAESLSPDLFEAMLEVLRMRNGTGSS